MSTSPPSPPLKDPFTAAILAWLVPGLGHLYQGRIAKGLLFSVCLMGTFLWGMDLGEWKVVYWAWDDRKPVVDGSGRLGMGFASVPAFLQSLRDDGLPLLGKFQAAPSRAELNELNARLNGIWEIAKLYTLIACLLNVLVILDAYGGPAEHADEPVLEPDKEAVAA